MDTLFTNPPALGFAKKIQQTIVEKSQAGHVARDALTTPKTCEVVSRPLEWIKIPVKLSIHYDLNVVQ